MKKILFINSCIYLPGEKAMKRTFYLFEMMRTQGYDVTFLTSDFNHYEKKSRDINEFFLKFPEYKNIIEFVHMEPYKKNISIRRYIINLMCDANIVEWFIKNGKEYDVVYITWPASYVVRKIRKFCDMYNTRMIIDINDLWPDSLKLIIGNNVLYNILTIVMRKNTNKAYSYADGLVAVSNEYLELASKHNCRATGRIAIYIGAMLEHFDAGVEKYKAEIEKEKDEFWLVYAGTLGKSYDIETVIRAVKKINEKNGLRIHFKILGQGPAEKYLRSLAKEINADTIEFMGFLEYEKMAAYLSVSDACMNCIKSNAPQSIINKIADYFASKNPVLNCGPCKEMKDLIENYNVGINYKSEDVDSCCKAIEYVFFNRNEAAEMGRKSRKLAEELFDRKVTHQHIIDMINEM